MRAAGISEEDWMLITAEESRRVDATLKEYRAERLEILQGVEASRGWVYPMENMPDESQTNGLRPPMLSDLSREVNVERIDEDVGEDAIAMRREQDGEKHPEGKIIVQTTQAEEEYFRQKSLGRAWKLGIIRAAYEV